MQVQLNTDSHVQGAESLAAWVETELKDKLARFRDQITRIEVHLSDINGERVGGDEKRCLLEARLTGRQPVAVSHNADKVADAVLRRGRQDAACAGHRPGQDARCQGPGDDPRRGRAVGVCRRVRRPAGLNPCSRWLAHGR